MLSSMFVWLRGEVVSHLRRDNLPRVTQFSTILHPCLPGDVQPRIGAASGIRSNTRSVGDSHSRMDCECIYIYIYIYRIKPPCHRVPWPWARCTHHAHIHPQTVGAQEQCECSGEISSGFLVRKPVNLTIFEIARHCKNENIYVGSINKYISSKPMNAIVHSRSWAFTRTLISTIFPEYVGPDSTTTLTASPSCTWAAILFTRQERLSRSRQYKMLVCRYQRLLANNNRQ